MHKGNHAVDWLIISLLSIVGLMCLLPILNSIAISFSDKTSASMGQVFLLPINANISSYKEIFRTDRYFRAFAVSVMRVLLGGSINILLSILIAYPLSKSSKVFRARNVYMWIFIFTMLFNGGLVPTYMVVRNLALIDTIWSLVLPGAVPVFSMIILMNYFKGIPASLEEAALVDGANPLYILTKIFIPLAKPSIATIALFAMVGHWNAFFDGKIYINSIMKQPLQTYIQSLTVTLSAESLSHMTPDEIIRRMETSSLTFNSAKVVVSMLPLLIVYPLLQKYFVAGIVMGAVKE